MTPFTAMQMKLDRGAAAAELIETILYDSQDSLAADLLRLRAAERSIYVCLMSLVDSCKLALTTIGFYEGTSDCRGIVELAATKGLIEASAARRLVAMADVPHRIVHDYDQITPLEVYGYLSPVLGLFTDMAPHFRKRIDSMREEC